MKAPKRCRACGETKELEDFYTHPGCTDGHVGTCKACYIKRTKARYSGLVATPELRKEYRKQSRAAYREGRWKRGPSSGGWGPKEREAHKTRYPEKFMARCHSSKIPLVPGMHMHHWSYCDEHHKDVVLVARALHYTIHRYMVYDQERMMYRTLGGVLLDTREAAEAYYSTLEDKE